MEQVEIKTIKKRKAIEINSRQAGREFIIEEIELGVGSNRKAIKYTDDFLKPETECKAVVIKEGRLKII